MHQPLGSFDAFPDTRSDFPLVALLKGPWMDSAGRPYPPGAAFEAKEGDLPPHDMTLLVQPCGDGCGCVDPEGEELTDIARDPHLWSVVPKATLRSGQVPPGEEPLPKSPLEDIIAASGGPLGAAQRRTVIIPVETTVARLANGAPIFDFMGDLAPNSLQQGFYKLGMLKTLRKRIENLGMSGVLIEDDIALLNEALQMSYNHTMGQTLPRVCALLKPPADTTISG